MTFENTFLAQNCLKKVILGLFGCKKHSKGMESLKMVSILTKNLPTFQKMLYISAWKLCTNFKLGFLESVGHLDIGNVFIRNGSCPKTKFRL